CSSGNPAGRQARIGRHFPRSAPCPRRRRRLTGRRWTGYLLRAEGFIASSRCSDELKGKSGASCPAGQFRRCPAAVIGNEPRHRTGPPAGKRRTVGTRPSPPVHEPEDLPRPEDASVFRLTWSLRGEVAGGIAWPWPRSVPAPVPLAAPARPRGRSSPWRRGRCPAAHAAGPSFLIVHALGITWMTLTTNLGFPRIGPR